MSFRHSGKLWIPFVLIFLITIYMKGFPQQKFAWPLPETQREDSENADVIKMTFEEWKIQYVLPSIKDDGTSDLESRFTSRRDLLKKGCHMLKEKHDSLGHQWKWQEVPNVKRNESTELSLMQIHSQGHYSICVIPKVGSTTWLEYVTMLKKQNFEADHSVNMIQIRHPLDRLRSAYTDKFLGGEVISKYTQQYRSEIDGRQGWKSRWKSYWLPALLSTGQLPSNKEFEEAVNKLRKDNSFYIKPKYAFEKAYNGNKKSSEKKYGNLSFTFEEFLRHVLWTKDLGLGDHHWVPQSELCNVCAGDFEYILKLENINQEIAYVLKTLKYPKIPAYKHTHLSKNNTKKSSYMDFYKDIPVDLFREILELYKFDFLFFGYSI